MLIIQPELESQIRNRYLAELEKLARESIILSSDKKKQLWTRKDWLLGIPLTNILTSYLMVSGSVRRSMGYYKITTMTYNGKFIENLSHSLFALSFDTSYGELEVWYQC